MEAIASINIRASPEAFLCPFMDWGKMCQKDYAGYPETSGVEMMVRYPVAVEHAEDGSWCAYTLSPTVITGLGDTRESALADLDAAAKFWICHMKETGQELPTVDLELTSIEVAA